ncbi:MAG: hypothetical protein MZV65_16375 [Chromatiales bacterium]|nr:hypothetical protein [Chromatiales bacterium]
MRPTGRPRFCKEGASHEPQPPGIGGHAPTTTPRQRRGIKLKPDDPAPAFDIATAIEEGDAITARFAELEADSDLQADLERLAEYERQQAPIELACFSEPAPAGHAVSHDQSSPPRIDIKDTAARALVASEAVCRHWLPEGKRQGHEWVSVNPTRADKTPGSFSVNLDTGQWADFATDDRGGDLVALVAYLDGTHQGDAARVLAEWLGAVPVVETAPKPAKKAPKAMQTRPTAHPKLGQPSAQWDYLDAEGRVLCAGDALRDAGPARSFGRSPRRRTAGAGRLRPSRARSMVSIGSPRRPEAPVILCRRREGRRCRRRAAAGCAFTSPP